MTAKEEKCRWATVGTAAYGERIESVADSEFVCRFSEDPGEGVSTPCRRMGVGLVRMRGPGRPLPEGFIISAESCTRYSESGELPQGPTGEVMDHSGEVDARSIREHPAFLNLTSPGTL